MTCEGMKTKLDDYVDGLLGAEASHGVEEHLEMCSACREEVEELRDLIARAGALPKEIAPGTDLWPGIAEQIGAARRFPAPWYRRPVAVAMPLAAGLVLAAAFLLQTSAPGPAGGAGSAAEPAYDAVDAPDAPDAGYADADADYAEARGELLEAIEESRDALAPETLQALEENLLVIDEAVLEIRTALEEDPGNPRLVRLLMATHQKGLDFLETVVLLSRRG